MNIEQICNDLAEITEKLMYGEISFSYDNLASAMKPGHPGEILDDIISIIGWDVLEGKEPPLENVKETLAGLEDFQRAFKVDLKKPIMNMKKYIAEKEKEE